MLIKSVSHVENLIQMTETTVFILMKEIPDMFLLCFHMFSV